MMSDPELLDGVLRLAAAAGCEMLRVLDPPQARRGWADAPVVVLDEDAALRCGQAGLPRRDNVLVVVRAEPPPQVWRHAVAIGAAHVVSLPDGETWLVRVLAEAAEARHGGAPPGRGRRGRGRVRRGGRLGPRRRTRGHGRAPRRPGAAGRLRPARRRARPGARRRAGRGPALARDRRRRRARPRRGVARGAARAPGHRRRGGRAGAALVRPVPARAHGGGGRGGARSRTAGGRNRRVRRTPLLHGGRGHGARRRRPDAAGRAGRRPRERRSGPGGGPAGRVRRQHCAWPCAGRRRVVSPPKRSPVRSTCPCSSRCDPSRGWPARSRPGARPGRPRGPLAAAAEHGARGAGPASPGRSGRSAS